MTLFSGESGAMPLGILLGNGASMAVWRRFGYTSLYERAADQNCQVHFEGCDRKLFEGMETKNFEAVLSALIVSGNTWKIFNKPNADIQDLRNSYMRVRDCLIHAVKEVHIPYDRISSALKQQLRTIMALHEYVYTTNYDLLLYWAMMEDPKQFKDFFWQRNANQTEAWFDVSDTDLWGEPCTKVIFLHGALHMYRNKMGTFKKIGGERGNLLEQFDVKGEAIPLFISEGTSKDKLSAIKRDDYLTFAYDRFSKHRGDLVVFGHSLSEAFDKHITDAMNKWTRYDQRRTAAAGGSLVGLRRRCIAISMRPTGDGHQITQEKVRLTRALAGYDLRFFDSTTHPLGDPSFNVESAS